MSPRRWLFTFLAALTLLRLLIIGQIELSPDEAYYYLWSERLDWSYFSKGPGVAVAMWLSTHLFGVSEFGVRAFSPLLALGTSLLMFSLARRLYSEAVAVWAVLTINVIPIFNVGGLVLTIDPLSIFFWMAALYTVWLALERSPEFSLWWPATGALIGLGFLAKYTNAMQLLSILLLLVITPKYRKELRRRGFYIMLGTFAVFTLPPVIWNAQHDWITLHHLTARGGLSTGPKFDPAEFLQFLGAHFGVYSPIIFAVMLVAIVWGWRRAAVHFKSRFLLAFTLPLFALYSTLSFKQAGEANWTAPATLSLGLLAAALFYGRALELQKTRRLCLIGLFLALLMSLVIVDTELPRRLGFAFPYRLDPSARLRGWRSAAQKVEEVRAEIEASQGQPVFLIANNYGSAASIGFYLRDRRIEAAGHPPVYVPESAFPENQFFFWPRYDENVEAPPDTAPKENYYTEEGGTNQFLGRTALYITERPEERPPSSIKRGFERVEMIRCIDFVRRGLPLRQVRIFACYNYQQVAL